MAITILQQPQLFSPVYNDLNFYVSSTNTGQSNFKYVFDTYVNGTMINRELRSPHPTYGTARFDPKRVISPSVLRDFLITDSDGVTKNTNSFVVIQVKCGEQYGPSSGLVTNTNLTNSNLIYAFAGSLAKLEFDRWDYTDYYGDAVHTGKFLTKRSRTYHAIKQSQNDWLSIYTNASGNLYTVVGETYDLAGNLLQNFDFTSPFQALSNTDDRFIKIAAGWNLNDITTLNSGAQPILSAGVGYFVLQITDGSSSAASELITTYIQQSCPYGDEYDIHFQNSLGFEETFRFTKWTSKQTQAEKKEYLKSNGTYSATAFTLDESDETNVNYFTKIDNRWILRSDWLNDNMVQWCKELIYSPQVRINIDGNLVPVTIETNNYDEITKKTGTIPKLDITIKLPSDYRQLG